MSSAFQLEVLDGGLATLTFDLPGRSANVFNQASMAELEALITELGDREDIRCLVLLSGKPRIFIAGADIDEISQITDAAMVEEATRRGQEIFEAWENLPFPTIAAVAGNCAGGGTELSLASDYIVISDRDDVRIGLPEVRLGIVPAWGGCTRLPRRIGVAAALDLILAGKMVRPKKAFRVGLADALLPNASFLAEVRKFAESVIAGRKPRSRKSSFGTKLLEGNPVGRAVLFSQARKQVMKTTKGHYPAPLRALEVVRTGLRSPKAGFAAETRAISELAIAPVSKNLVHVYQLMEGSKRGGADGVEALEIDATAVLGAGTMGGGIAHIIADKTGLEIRLKDISDEALAGAMSHAAGLFKKQVKRRWMSPAKASAKLNLIRPALAYSGLERTDLVIEAVIENLDVKRKVFAELEARVSETAILASNTSSISIDAIARDVRHPERVVGMHFFNPVDKMPLVEVVVGPRTGPVAVQTVVEFTRRLGKTPVVVKDGPGFLVNRLLGFTLAEALWLLDEGMRIEDLDRAVERWGMPMGPMILSDEVGIDVGVKVAHILTEGLGERMSFPEWFDRMPEDGRLGTKAGRGFYKYEKGKRQGPDSAVYELLGLSPGTSRLDESQVTDRFLLPMVNEAARCLDEGLVASPGDLDLAMIMGTGFPPFRGGLCRWADSQGLGDLLETMERLAGEVGHRFQPSEAFRAAATAGGFYTHWG